ncbi:MAG TPA: hypothetical protein VE931_00085 [Pyrinomonadaceae bacterium]|nr:hypothetical protein [Pyrinomonadaceae bacterium]
MKRCPQCLFLFPDSDSTCDFDQTPLEHVDDSAIESAARKPKSRALPIAAAIGLILSILVFAIYYGLIRQQQKASAAPETPVTVAPVTAPPATPSPTAGVSPSPSPSPSLAPSPRSSPEKVSTAHTRATSDPVSTSGPGMGNRQGGKPVIMLASGGKIEADEVWRTKDGVWYRRNGMVTLLKRAQVKTIVTR